jgi:O-antigen/teichoic acid export membrane protein
MGYTHKALQGFGWNSLVKGLSLPTTAIKVFILARLLSPQDFGLFSLVAIGLGIMESLTETGVNTTIIQSSKSVQYFLDTAWVIAIIRGLIISILMLIAGLFMQNFYHEPQLLPLLAVAAFIPLIKGFINPSIVSFYKNMHFFRDSLYQYSLIAVDAATAIVFAFFIHSAFVFLFAMIASALFEVSISFLFFKDRPRFCYISSRGKEILHNAKGLNLSSLQNYVVQNVDNLILGKILGTEVLGIYANSYSLSHKVNVELAKSVTRGTFPVYVRLHNEGSRLTNAFWRSSLLSMVGFFVLSVPFLFFPQLTVSILLGPKWQSAVPLLPLLVLAGLIQSFVLLVYNLFLSEKQYQWLNLSLFINSISLIIGLLFLGSKYGLMGGVTAVLVSRLLTLPVVGVGLWMTLRTLKLKPSASRSLS